MQITASWPSALTEEAAEVTTLQAKKVALPKDVGRQLEDDNVGGGWRLGVP